MVEMNLVIHAMASSRIDNSSPTANIVSDHALILAQAGKTANVNYGPFERAEKGNNALLDDI